MPKLWPLLCLSLAGCASHAYVGAGAQTQFNYEMWLPGHSREQIWSGARDYFSSSAEGQAVAFDVLDPASGNISGGGRLPWHLPDGAQCLVRYQLQLTVSDDRSRLRLLAVLDDISGGDDCDRWRRISPAGYQEVQGSFARTATALQARIGGPMQSPERQLDAPRR